MSFMRILAEALGVDFDAPRPAPPEPVPAAPVVQPTTPEGYTVAYAYSPRENVGSTGKVHLITAVPIQTGRLKREAGDALCKPYRQFWGLDGGRTPEDFETYGCKRCREIRDSLKERA
jgi:hypothetical protein